MPPALTHRLWLYTLLICTTLNCVVWAIIIPPLWANDEPQHFLFVHDFTENPQLYVPPEKFVLREVKALGDWAGFPDARYTDDTLSPPTPEDSQRVWAELGKATLQPAAPINWDYIAHRGFRKYHPNLYPVVGMPVQIALQRQLVSVRLFALRLLSAALAVLTVYGVYRLGLALWDDDETSALGLATFTAFQPSFVYFGSVCNNQMLETCLFIFATLLVLSALQRGFWTTRQALWLGVVGGLGLLTRATFLPLFVSLLVAPLFLALKNEKKELLRRWVLILGIPAAMSLWWYVSIPGQIQEGVLSSYFQGQEQAGFSRPDTAPLTYLANEGGRQWAVAFKRYWIGGTVRLFGLQEWHRPELAVFSWLSGGLLICLLILLATRRLKGSPALWVLLLPVAGQVGALQVLDYISVAYGTGYFTLRGQYLVPLTPALGVAMIAAAQSLLGRVDRPRAIAGTVLSLLLVVFNFVLMGTLLHLLHGPAWGEAARLWWLSPGLFYSLLVGLLGASATLSLVALATCRKARLDAG